MSAPVFLAGPSALAGARTGGSVGMRGPEARHAASVRRMRAGEVLDLVDGAGTRVRGTIASASPEELVVTVSEISREPAPVPALVLVQALAKGGRDEQAVETATEAGVDAVVPWQSERCVSVWAGTKAERGRMRWEAVALAAAKQSRRAWVPGVRDLVVGRRLVAEAAAVVGRGGAVLVLHEEASVPLAEATLPGPGAGAGADASSPGRAEASAAPLAPRTDGSPVRPGDGAAHGADTAVVPEVLVVVGPEGGLSSDEVDALAGAGAQVVRLGPHVLRTSTAGPLAIALLAQRLGRWG